MVNLNNLFALIDSRGLNQKQVHEATGISTGNISDWKKGRSMPSANALDILANYFECSVDYILGRTNNPIMNTTISGNTITTGDNSIQAVMNSSVTVESHKSEEYREIIEMLDGLTLVQRSEIVVMINKMKSEE